MKMKRRAEMLGLIAYAMMSENMPLIDDSQFVPTIHEKDRYKKLLLKRGVLEFTINGVTVLARSEANANRKINSLLKHQEQDANDHQGKGE